LTQHRWNTIAIVGPGLIGASLGQALLRRGVVGRVVGVARRRSTLNQARQVGAITHGSTSLPRAVREAELVVVCTPVAAVAQGVQAALEHTPPQAVVTDAGSVKEPIVQAVWSACPKQATRFVPAHPLAGSHQSGPRHARADLFQDRLAILTPVRQNPAEAVEQVERLWQCVGARTVRLSAREHDRRMAWTSHLPHVVAAVLAGTVPPRWNDFTGTGYRDTTRLAAGEVELWVQILTENAPQVQRALEQFEKQLQQWLRAVRRRDARALGRLLQQAKRRRDAVGN